MMEFGVRWFPSGKKPNKPASKKMNKSYIEVVKVPEKVFLTWKLDKECLLHLQNLFLFN